MMCDGAHTTPVVGITQWAQTQRKQTWKWIIDDNTIDVCLSTLSHSRVYIINL